MMDREERYALPLLSDLPEAELAWLLANSYEVSVEVGEFFVREFQPATSFYVVLEGELQVTRSLDGREMALGTTPRGVMGGELSLLNGSPSTVNARAIQPSRLLVFDVAAFRGIFAAAPTFGARIFQTAAERMYNFASTVKQQEKLAALGKLSAGLAHELNNPSTAARRASQEMHSAMNTLQKRTLALSALRPSDAQIARLADFLKGAMRGVAEAPGLSPLEQSDREEEMGSWLDDLGIDESWELAPAFVAAGLTTDDLATLADEMPADTHAALFAWLQTNLDVATLLDTIEHSSRRISDLVAAIKSYTYMDQGTLQDVDIHADLEKTLRILNHKLGSIQVIREYANSLPTIQGRGSELNQVWTNLLDNAIDVLKERSRPGTIWVMTRNENDFVMVEIADDGPGIPAELQGHIFEPFFTTKQVGAGTGLGLDITYRIIQNHSGTIEVRSEPGRTRFIVRLPLQGLSQPLIGSTMNATTGEA